MAHMVDATVELLRIHTPDEITVRQIAESSGHHHRFVQAWFGGKPGLFRAVFDRMAADVADNIRVPFQPQPDSLARARALARVMSWLITTDPAAFSGPRPMPVVDRVTAVYIERFGFDPALARLMAVRLVGTTVTALLYGDALGLTAADFPAIAQLEMELAGHLAAARQAHGS